MRAHGLNRQHRSNCTLLELKPLNAWLELGLFGVQIVPYWNWNFGRFALVYVWIYCSNCTLLELKLYEEMKRLQEATVQIVPYWNWNPERIFGMKSAPCSNCTLLELKHDRRGDIANSKRFKLYLTGIETTLHESGRHNDYQFKLYLTGIETRSVKDLRFSVLVQIVPYWNWNSKGYNYLHDCVCSNCTLLELKRVSSSAFIYSSVFKLHLTGIETQEYEHRKQQYRVQIAPYWNWNWSANPIV